ncbi:uncharacterized protein B0P05DRAFT_511213 [Gilbertella persicaria]|uniref:uncharacterized protein n=1 Tax=Gilbertella persicaria TaxID=101096 RepID=UPI0022208BF7|nr:uncharacterized protein B0P05DRAFT_511213 [Gilbertella persicaria]KAI8077248.1 hypothetical protein B0P05DRAFT_511213 [Gilbertella persicaria]
MRIANYVQKQQKNRVDQSSVEKDLDSVQLLKKEIDQAQDKKLSQLISHHQCICVIDQVLSLARYNNKYYLLQYQVLSEEYIYQCIVFGFSRFGKLVLSPPLSITEYIQLGFMEDADTSILLSEKELLLDYFSTDIEQDNGQIYLKSLPMIIMNYVPSFLIERIPLFVFNLITQIDWQDEISCLDGLAKLFATLYYCTTKEDWELLIQCMYKNQEFKASKYLAEQGYIVELDIPTEMTLFK